jgi:hypothetical protein
MEKDRIVDILRALAAGRDPHTGEPLAGAYQHVDTVRALYGALDLIAGRFTGPIDATTVGKVSPPQPQPTPAKPASRSRGASNTGKAWTSEEDERLLAAFDAGRTPQAIAAEHGRSRLAIEARLARFGRMPMPAGVRKRETATAPAPGRTDDASASAAAVAAPEAREPRPRRLAETHH